MMLLLAVLQMASGVQKLLSCWCWAVIYSGFVRSLGAVPAADPVNWVGALSVFGIMWISHGLMSQKAAESIKEKEP